MTSPIKNDSHVLLFFAFAMALIYYAASTNYNMAFRGGCFGIEIFLTAYTVNTVVLHRLEQQVFASTNPPA